MTLRASYDIDEENRLLDVLLTEKSVNYTAEQYQFDKIIGKRSETGELKLKKLKGHHMKIIAYHLRCLSNANIAFITGLSENAISRILRDPLSIAYIQENINASEEELEALMPLATAAVRRGLQSTDTKTALGAADRFFRATGRYDRDDSNSGKDTAEDVIQRALAVMENQAGALNNLTRPDRPKALDVQFSEVDHGDDSNNSVKTLERLSPVDVERPNGN